MTARFQYAEDFAEYFVFVRDQVQHAIAEYYVGLIGGKGHIFYVAQAKLYIVEVQLFSIFPCF